MRKILQLKEDVRDVGSKIPADLLDIHVLLTREMPGFSLSGLKKDSVIQLNKLATINKSLIKGEFGEIDSGIKKDVRRILMEIFDR